MITLSEVLKQSGLSQEQIDALDAKVMKSLGGVLTTAEQAQQEAAQKQQAAQEAAAKAEADRKAAEAAQEAARAAKEAAEFQKRSVDEFWQNTYNPGVAAWEAEKAALAKKAADAAAEAAFYKQQRESLKDLGIVPADAPVFTPANDTSVSNGNGQGKFVAGSTGSPVFDTNTVINKVGDGMNMIQNIMWKYQTLYGGQPMPIAPSELIQKADQLKLDPMEFAARTFRFAEKEEEQRQAAARAHDEQVAKAEREKADAEWKAKIDQREAEFAAKEKLRAEQSANNPDVRVPVSSRMPELIRQVKTNEMPDPLMMNENQRRAQTTKMIREAISQKDQVVA